MFEGKGEFEGVKLEKAVRNVLTAVCDFELKLCELRSDRRFPGFGDNISTSKTREENGNSSIFWIYSCCYCSPVVEQFETGQTLGATKPFRIFVEDDLSQKCMDDIFDDVMITHFVQWKR